ncbi:3-methyl-2-oxobutanoate hydroxymethyltransferase [Candidatus Providencia siddallii]|uniref:3-methyl-2-oxobutanoate hydroxymethyltransferase n=1 Tax=Candidatus Providencia siddallii TaxID=1715285 RepID=A0A0M6W964_9GAMM|nr:3-methyl-2-oxobutanoate hydroxymethyltransferase [Candidatus Providencia siddallii]
MKSVYLNNLYKFKKDKHKFAAITAYDYSFAKIFSEHGIKILLVGDSLGMTIQGELNTLKVTIKEMSYHTRCVRKGAPDAFIIADMPFMSYATLDKAYKNAAKLIQAGANMIKVEGDNWLYDTIKMLTDRSVPVCGHLGLTPQYINILNGYKVQGKNNTDANKIIKSAISLENAGIKLLVLECIPVSLATIITKKLSIPTIGIGAGNKTDGQILVMQDAFGLTYNPPKFSKNFLKQAGNLPNAIHMYIEEVKNSIFPDKIHSFI